MHLPSISTLARLGRGYTLLLLASVATLLCPPLSGAPASGPDGLAENQIRQRLGEICDAVAKKDLPRLDSYHAYGPKFSKFAEGPLRLDSEAARRSEHQGLAAVDSAELELENLKIDVFGNTGIATFIMHATVKTDGRTGDSRSRGTLVFLKEGSSWKIVHEHFSPMAMATPSVRDPAR